MHAAQFEVRRGKHMFLFVNVSANKTKHGLIYNIYSARLAESYFRIVLETIKIENVGYDGQSGT